MQIGVVRRPVRQNKRGFESVQVRLISRRSLEGGGLHFDETSGTEPAPRGSQNPRSGEQPVAPFSVSGFAPKGSHHGRVQEWPRRETREDWGRSCPSFLAKMCMFRVIVTNLPLNKHPQSQGRNMPSISED